MMDLNLKIMPKEIKCYCGHTKTCDCGKKVETALDWFNNELDDILQLYPSEWDEIQKNVTIAKEMEKKQLIEFAKYILHENHEYKSYENIVSNFFERV